ncbi:hypothetical protein K7432_007315 [Basidiobolus ranarum]|uniref:Uncharacterized protein n=1 Tax=Basidiobolus ranarum TaxID=34480 RepID=A0ABR2W0C1_9FUNG
MSSITTEQMLESSTEASHLILRPTIDLSDCVQHVIHSIQINLDLISSTLQQPEDVKEISSEPIQVSIANNLQNILIEVEKCLLQPTGEVQIPSPNPPLVPLESPMEFHHTKDLLKQKAKNIRPLLDDFEQCFGLINVKPEDEVTLEHSPSITGQEKETPGLTLSNENPQSWLKSYTDQMDTLQIDLQSQVKKFERFISNDFTISEVERNQIKGQLLRFEDIMKKYIVQLFQYLQFDNSDQSTDSILSDVNKTIGIQTSEELSIVQLSHNKYVHHKVRISELYEELKSTKYQSELYQSSLMEAELREQEFTKAIFEFNEQIDMIQGRLYTSQQYTDLLENEVIKLSQRNEQLAKKQESEKFNITLQEIRDDFTREITNYKEKMIQLEEELETTLLHLKASEENVDHFYSIAGAWNKEFKQILQTLTIANKKELLLDSLISTMASLENVGNNEILSDLDHLESLRQQLCDTEANLKDVSSRKDQMAIELGDGQIHLQIVLENSSRLERQLELANIGQSYVDSIHQKLEMNELLVAKSNSESESEQLVLHTKTEELIDSVERDHLTPIQDIPILMADTNRQLEENKTSLFEAAQLKEVTEIVQSIAQDLGLQIDEKDAGILSLAPSLQDVREELLKLTKRAGHIEELTEVILEAETKEEEYIRAIFELSQEVIQAKQSQSDHEKITCLLESAIQEELASNKKICEEQRFEHLAKEKEYLSTVYSLNAELKEREKSLMESEKRVLLFEAHTEDTITLLKSNEQVISQLREELTNADMTEREYLQRFVELTKELDHTIHSLVEQQKQTHLFESSVNCKLLELEEMRLQNRDALHISRNEISTLESHIKQLEFSAGGLQSIVEMKELTIQNLQAQGNEGVKRLHDLTQALELQNVALHAHFDSILRLGIDIGHDSTQSNLLSILNSLPQKLQDWLVDNENQFRDQKILFTKQVEELESALIQCKLKITEQEKLLNTSLLREQEILERSRLLQIEDEKKLSNCTRQLEETLTELKTAQQSIDELQTEKSKSTQPFIDNLESDHQDDTNRASQSIDFNAISASTSEHDHDSAVALDDESESNEEQEINPNSVTKLAKQLSEAQAQVRTTQASYRDMDDQMELLHHKLKETKIQLASCDRSREAFAIFISDIGAMLGDPRSEIEDVITFFFKQEATLELKEETRRLAFGNFNSSTLSVVSRSNENLIKNDISYTSKESTRARASTFSGNTAQEFRKLRNELNIYANEIETLNAQKKDYEKQCHSFREAIVVSQTREGRLSREVQELRSRLEAHKVESMCALADLQTKYRESFMEVDVKNRQHIEELEKELFITKKRIVRLKEQVMLTEKVCTDAVALTEQLEIELARTWKEKRTAEKKLLESQQRCEDLNKDLRVKEIEALTQKQLYESKLKDLDLKVRNQAKSMTNAKREATHNSSEKRASFYQQLRSKWSGSTTEESRSIMEPRTINESEKGFQEEVDMHVTTNKLLQTELCEIQAKTVELELHKELLETQLSELRSLHDQSERTLTQLRREAEENQQATLVSLERAQAEKQSSARVELVTIQAERASQERIILELKKELCNLHDDQNQKTNELQIAKQEIEVLRRLSSTNAETRAVLEALTREKFNLETKVNELETQLDDILAKNVAFAMELAAVK